MHVGKTKEPRCSLTPRSLPGQMPHADLGALPTFLVYRYTMRLPGVRDLQSSTGIIEYNRCTAGREAQSCQLTYSQSGFVGGGVVGQPTTVSQALDHLEAGDKTTLSLGTWRYILLALLAELRPASFNASLQTDLMDQTATKETSRQ